MGSTYFPQYRVSLYFFNGPLAKSLRDFQDIYIPIGSAHDKNVLIIPDHSIQPEHAYIVQDKGHVYIKAHHPTFYLAINNRPAQNAELHDGDNITLGNASITCQLQLQIEAQEIEATQSASTGFMTGGYQQTQASANARVYQAQQPRSTPNVAPLTRPFSQNMQAYQQRDDVTRYLCAAVHSDEAFRDYVIEHILDEEIKAPGEAYGADIIPIARWAFAARRRTLIRDIILICSSFLGPIILGILLPLFYNMLATASYNILAPVSPQLAFLVYAAGPLFSFFISIPLYIGLFILLLVLLIGRPFPPAKNRRWLLMTLISFFLVPTSFTGIILFVPWLVMIAERFWCYYGPGARLLTRGNFRPDVGGAALDPQMEQRLRARFPQRDGNFVVYSGYSPFAGSGIDIHSWSFVVDVSRGKENIDHTRATPTSFKVKELYAAQAKAIHHLGLKNLRIEDKLYANGKELRNQQANYQQEFLPDPFAHPRTGISKQMVEDFKEHPTEDIRYYQCIKIASWKGDLILSIFIRFYLVGKNPTDKNDSGTNLFVEGNYQLLAPIEERYREIDRITTSLNLRRGWHLFKRAFIPTTFKRILGTPFRLIRAVFRGWSLETKIRQTKEEIADNPSFDYGAITSLREVVSSDEYQYHFQRLDKEMHVKLIEYQVFETIIAFLDERNIDTTQLRERQQLIINSGTVVTGGTFNASAMTFGARANVNMTGSSPASGAHQTTTK
jgi:hypothetical protein